MLGLWGSVHFSNYNLLFEKRSMDAPAVWTRTEPVTITQLPYELNGLEPVIPQEIMEYHYGKHHTAYCAKYNTFMPQYHEAVAAGNTEKANSLIPKIAFNYGGYWNHDQYWLNLTGPGTGGGDISKGPSVVAAIKDEWGSVENFQEKFNEKTAAIMVIFLLIPGIWLGMACLQQADQGPHLPGFERSRYCRGRRQWPVYWASDCRYLGACFLPQMEECERRLSQRYLADRELG